MTNSELTCNLVRTVSNTKAQAAIDRVGIHTTLFENPELTAMAAICDILRDLTHEQRMRVMRWSFGRFSEEFKLPVPPQAPAPAGPIAAPGGVGGPRPAAVRSDTAASAGGGRRSAVVRSDIAAFAGGPRMTGIASDPTAADVAASGAAVSGAAISGAGASDEAASDGDNFKQQIEELSELFPAERHVRNPRPNSRPDPRKILEFV